ncbi:malonyl-ACP O-methyltransferase BioC [Marinomonas atlantica]|uniref:malonyl-ACP O-methyltransferase BioC n=1 Tax=Marinomonas atlantica TaxID=1806668 RepID=UPI00083537D6|nr:malonyl-ACP O-methyltransferase BioC [Marinomonas atlantica]MCO4785862.1 malonyl-ACP O-methyltransferase BioC [Marinomonas atlantica]
MTTRLTNSDIVYKQKVANSFSRAAHSYDQYAVFQEQVLTQLIEWYFPVMDQRWLDLGTGTGRALSVLNGQQVVGLDLSFSMLHKARQRVPSAAFVCADAEALPFANSIFDGVMSSLAIQWCLTPSRLFSELFRVLNDQGQVLVSTLVSGSMPELSQAWQGVDGRSHHNHYPSMAKILDDCKAAGFIIQRAQQHTMTVHYPTVKEAVYSLKKVGASVVMEDSSVISPSKWKAFELQYKQLQTPLGIPLSYEVAFIQLTKVDHG